jgi:quercetin dioxygenase-like cupin family protein
MSRYGKVNQSGGPFFIASDIEWQATAEGVKRQILAVGTDLMLVRVDFDAGAVGAMHHHPHRQATYVATGTFDITVGEDKHRVTAGDSFVAPADVPHGVKAIEAGTLLDCFTPIREDFLASSK